MNPTAALPPALSPLPFGTAPAAAANGVRAAFPLLLAGTAPTVAPALARVGIAGLGSGASAVAGSTPAPEALLPDLGLTAAPAAADGAPAALLALPRAAPATTLLTRSLPSETPLSTSTTAALPPSASDASTLVPAAGGSSLPTAVPAEQVVAPELSRRQAAPVPQGQSDAGSGTMLPPTAGDAPPPRALSAGWPAQAKGDAARITAAPRPSASPTTAPTGASVVNDASPATAVARDRAGDRPATTASLTPETLPVTATPVFNQIAAVAPTGDRPTTMPSSGPAALPVMTTPVVNQPDAVPPRTAAGAARTIVAPRLNASSTIGLTNGSVASDAPPAAATVVRDGTDDRPATAALPTPAALPVMDTPVVNQPDAVPPPDVTTIRVSDQPARRGRQVDPAAVVPRAAASSDVAPLTQPGDAAAPQPAPNRVEVNQPLVAPPAIRVTSDLGSPPAPSDQPPAADAARRDGAADIADASRPPVASAPADRLARSAPVDPASPKRAPSRYAMTSAPPAMPVTSKPTDASDSVGSAGQQAAADPTPQDTPVDASRPLIASAPTGVPIPSTPAEPASPPPARTRFDLASAPLSPTPLSVANAPADARQSLASSGEPNGDATRRGFLAGASPSPVTSGPVDTAAPLPTTGPVPPPAPLRFDPIPLPLATGAMPVASPPTTARPILRSGQPAPGEAASRSLPPVSAPIAGLPIATVPVDLPTPPPAALSRVDAASPPPVPATPTLSTATTFTRVVAEQIAAEPSSTSTTASPLPAAAPAVAPAPAALLQPAVGTTAPAAQLFALAIQAADRQDRLRAGTAGDASAAPVDPLAALGFAPAAAPAPAATPAAAALDMRHDGWPAQMVAHIERLRDQADAGADASSTRIRIVPDALGSVDVSLRRHDDGGVQVALVADRPATQALLAEARPELARLGEARGVRLVDGSAWGAGTGASTSGGTGGEPGGQPRRGPTPPAAPASAFLSPHDDTSDAADGRVA